MTTTATAKKEKITGILAADSRETSGKGAARALRREGKIPAVLYSKGKAPVSIALTLKDVTQEYSRGRFRSRTIEIKLAGQSVKALPKELQFNPVTDVIEHVDFIRIEAGMKLRVMIPVKIIGQDKSPGLKRGGVLNLVRHEVEFLCAADAIPTHIEISVAELEIGGSVHIKDVKLPAGITPVIKRNFTVATVAGRTAEEEEVKPVAAVAADGTVPAEGAAPGAPGAPAAPGAAPAAGAPGAAPAADAKKDDGKKDKKK